jgi:hypothetical protein
MQEIQLGPVKLFQEVDPLVLVLILSVRANAQRDC